MPRSWDRRADEPLDAYLAFVAYCQALPTSRSVGLVAAVLNADGAEWRSRETLDDWERRFRWKERAAAWDAESPRKDKPDERSPFAEMTGRHQKEALALQQKLLERLRRLDPEDLRPAEIIRWFDVSVRVEKETLEARESDDQGDRRREFLDALLADSEACDLAGRLVERLASGQPVAGGAGVVGDAQSVEVGEAPGEARSAAG
jgi:hypothetical protein